MISDVLGKLHMLSRSDDNLLTRAVIPQAKPVASNQETARLAIWRPCQTCSIELIFEPAILPWLEERDEENLCFSLEIESRNGHSMLTAIYHFALLPAMAEDAIAFMKILLHFRCSSMQRGAAPVLCTSNVQR